MERLVEAVGLVRSFLITIPLIYIATILWATLSLLVSIFDSAGRGQHWCARWWARTLLAISGVRVRVRGAENIPSGGACVFVSNHQSYMDIPVVYGYLPAEFRILAKSSLFDIPFIGWHLRRAGNMPVGKDNPRRAARTLLAAARNVKRGTSVFIFPEGGRSLDGRLDTFREGAFLLALRAGVSVVPITLNGTRSVMPRARWHLRGGNTDMILHPPIATDGFTGASIGDLANRVRRTIAADFDEAAATSIQ